MYSSLIAVLYFSRIYTPFAKDNFSAINVYKSKGFEIKAVRKGYYNGIKNIYKTSLASLLEQFSRIGFVVIVLTLSINKGLIYATTLSLIALSFGELLSLIYLIIQIKKEKRVPWLYRADNF